MTLERALHFSPSSGWKEWFYHEGEKKMMEWHVHEATEWGNGGHTALEAGREWPLIPVSLCSSGSGPRSTHSPSDLIKAGSKWCRSHERLQRGVGEGSNSFVIWWDVECGEGEMLGGLRGVEIVTALEKWMLPQLTWVLCCSVTSGGKDNILAFHPLPFLTLRWGFVVSFLTAYSVSLRAGYI